MQRDLSNVRGRGASADCVSTETQGATVDEGRRLLQAFRAITCAQTRSRIIDVVEAEALRTGFVGSA